MEIYTRISRFSGLAAIRHVLVDAVLGFACGALYGVVFSGFKSIGAKDLYSLTLEGLALGAIAGIAVASCGLLYGSASAGRTD